MRRICIVTGGANGIGRCISEEFINNDDFVAIIDTDSVSGNRIIQRYGEDKVMFFCGDIANKGILDEFSQTIIDKFGKVDVVINNACISKGGLLDCSYDDFNYVLSVGVTAPFYLAKIFKNYFSDNSSIVNISSTRAYMSQANTESYTSAKGAISSLTHALSVSFAGKVRVNSISPGWIDTGGYQYCNDDYVPKYQTSDNLQHSVGRVGTPKDIADMVMFLCSDKSGFITGQNINIDGGMTKLMIYHNDLGWNYTP